MGPYVASRVVIQGPDVRLPPKYALTLALLVHGLATNSAKYGSLSVPGGVVLLISRMAGTLLEIDWQERDGPTVIAPQKQGFGLRLLSRALAQFGGNTELLFEPSRVIWKMKINLPADTVADQSGDDERPITAAAT
ncbi:sensor histidine kinase [Bradyrhizobium jicamae]|uniref:histidine kinase n=1 Tax=Bradyrhizobium jicamae TaxID=280332 RepID=A0ABS5FAJ5_9BRAD|nr:sensor histidine kinase [Bradyrhizobium jicamae]MBR0793814.1 sensor histidine kinase [Bradyrhizobium jicamae]